MASPELTDPRSARVRRLRRLARRASRAEERQFLAEGAQVVREALRAHSEGSAHVIQLIVSTDASLRQSDLIDAAQAANVSISWASDRVLAALTETVTPQGLVAVVEYLDVGLAEMIAQEPRLVAVLADVRDPGNAGSVIRAADAAGADAVIFAGDSVDPYNGKAVRASVGGIFHLSVVTGVSVPETLIALRNGQLTVLAADGSGDVDLDTAQLDSSSAAWVFGNEAWGVPDAVLAVADAAVRIPIYGKAESLNLATAATLCLYASARAQRSGGTGPVGAS
ncbi:MAG: RNA methyltransferase [Actinomycetes bacterium]